MSAVKTEPLQIIPNQPLSWSFYRHNLFSFCKRAYFYHYYGAQTGWDKYSDKRSRALHKLKQIKHFNSWIEELTVKAIQDNLVTPSSRSSRKNKLDAIKNDAYKAIRRQINENNNKEWIDDHKKLCLFETYFNPSKGSEKIIEQAVNKVENAVDNFAKTALFQELSEVNYYQWKAFTPPVYAYVNRMQIWASPSLIWHEKDSLHTLNIKLSEPNKNNKYSLAISAIYLAQRSHIPYEDIQSRTISLSNETTISSGYCSIEDLLQMIFDSAESMRALASNNKIAYEDNFTKCCDPENCKRCKFIEYCKN